MQDSSCILGSTVDTHSITKEVFSIVGFQQRSIRHLPIIRFNQLGQASYDQLQTFKPFSVVSLTRGGQLVSHHISTVLVNSCSYFWEPFKYVPQCTAMLQTYRDSLFVLQCSQCFAQILHLAVVWDYLAYGSKASHIFLVVLPSCCKVSRLHMVPECGGPTLGYWYFFQARVYREELLRAKGWNLLIKYGCYGVDSLCFSLPWHWLMMVLMVQYRDLR